MSVIPHGRENARRAWENEVPGSGIAVAVG